MAQVVQAQDDAERSMVLAIEYAGDRLRVTVHDGETPDGPVVAQQDFADSIDSTVAAAWCIGVLERHGIGTSSLSLTAEVAS